jgi:hypothetical protein
LILIGIGRATPGRNGRQSDALFKTEQGQVRLSNFRSKRPSSGHKKAPDDAGAFYQISKDLST